MTKAKINLTALALIVVCLLTLICMATVNLTFAQEQQPKVLDLERDAQAKVSLAELDKYDGVIMNARAVNNNLQAIKEYVERRTGKVLIPNRERGNLLGWSVTGVEDGNIITEPLTAYMADGSELDKANIDYKTLVPARAVSASGTPSGIPDGYMSCLTTVYVYALKSVNIAIVQIRVAVDHYPTHKELYNYYIAGIEANVCPISSVIRVNEFDIQVMTAKHIYMDRKAINTNSIDCATNSGFDFKTGVEIGDGVNLGVEYKYNYQISNTVGSVNVSRVAEYNVSNEELKNYDYTTYRVKPNIESEFGRAYTGVVSCTYRVNEYNECGAVQFTFKGLSISSDGIFNFSKGNSEAIAVTAVWDNPFKNKSLTIISYLDGEDSSKMQGFGSISCSASMPLTYSNSEARIYSE